MEDEFEELFDELFELELLDEFELLLELELELEFRDEFDELLELRLELQPPLPSSLSRLERVWLEWELRVTFWRKRVTGSSAIAGGAAAAPVTRHALRIARNFFMTVSFELQPIRLRRRNGGKQHLFQ